MHTSSNELYVIDHSLCPPSILPTGLDRFRLIDITEIHHAWRVYVDPESGRVHNGADYACQLAALLR